MLPTTATEPKKESCGNIMKNEVQSIEFAGKSDQSSDKKRKHADGNKSGDGARLETEKEDAGTIPEVKRKKTGTKDVDSKIESKTSVEVLTDSSVTDKQLMGKSEKTENAGHCNDVKPKENGKEISIVKEKRQEKNPFAAALAKANEKNSSSFFSSFGKNDKATFKEKSIFGSGKNGFGKKNDGDLFSFSNQTTSSFFGSKASSLGGNASFGSSSTLKSNYSGIIFGQKSECVDKDAQSFPIINSIQSKSNDQKLTTTVNNQDKVKKQNFPVSDVVKNGEENESCVLQYRAKLFRLSLKTESKSVLSEKDSPNNNISGTDTDSSMNMTNWKEVGIGPLRVLKSTFKQTTSKSASEAEEVKQSTYRIVQRRECTPGGPGTKVILNVCLGGKMPCTISRLADKFVRMATVETTEKVMYLFKVKTVEEANTLEKTLKDCITSTK